MFKFIDQNHIVLEDTYLQMRSFRELRKLYPNEFEKCAIWIYYMYSPYSIFFSNYPTLKERLEKVNYELDLPKAFNPAKAANSSAVIGKIVDILQPNIIKQLSNNRLKLTEYITTIDELDITERDDFKKPIHNFKTILEIRERLPKIIVEAEKALTEQISNLTSNTKVRKEQDLNEFNS